MVRCVVPAAVLLFFVFTLVVPLARRRDGRALAVLRAEAPIDRVVAASLAMLGGVVVVWAALVAVTGEPTAPPWASALGAALAAAGLVLVVVAQAQMGASWRIGIDREPTALVTRGLFRFVRNPIFTGMALAVAGLAFATPSPVTAIVAVATAAGLALQARFEEEHLLWEHGDAYRAYASRAGRFVPGVGRL